jgi:hypothetical protein
VEGVEQIVLTRIERTGCLVARLAGRLDAVGYRGVRDLLVKLALEEPRALVVDVDALDMDVEPALSLIASARMRVSEWPDVPILLVARDSRQRALLTPAALRHLVPVFSTIEAAIASVKPRPRHSALAEFPPVAASSARSRRFVRAACDEWGIGQPREDVLSVTSELVENAFKHAGTPMQVRLELRNGLLSVAVRDGSPRPAVLRQSSSGAPVGYGLRIVAGLARAWGCSPDLGGGKVVWAVLATGRSWLRKLRLWRTW